MARSSRSRRRFPLVAVAVAAVAVLIGVLVGSYRLGSGSSDEPSSRPTLPTLPTSTQAPTRQPPTSPRPAVAPIVLAVSLDGLNPDAITQLGAARTPNLHRLMREGASTLNARSAVEITKTLPNHTGMLTGRPITGRAGHGVTFNEDNGGTLEGTHGSYVPGMFDVAHDRGLQTAFFAEKDKFHFLMRSWDAEHGAEDVTGPDNGRDKTDIDAVSGAARLVAGVDRLLVDGRVELMFLHLTAPDHAGHESGWMGDEYLDAVRDVDASLGAILRTIDRLPSLRSRVSILVTADHGGPKGETTHYAEDQRANYRIPFIAWGRGFPPGVDLYTLNPGRKDPGNGRPGYTGPQPIRNMDIADTALELLGLPSVPGALASSWPPLVIKGAAS